MKKAIILYSSQTGTTKKFGEQIADLLTASNIEPTVLSIDDYSDETALDGDYVFLGCWTNGLMVLFQHPSKVWVKFAQKLPNLNGKKIVLFTTYKLATGVMFKSMKKHISGEISLELKSRDGKLSEEQKRLIKKFIG